MLQQTQNHNQWHRTANRMCVIKGTIRYFCADVASKPFKKIV